MYRAKYASKSGSSGGGGAAGEDFPKFTSENTSLLKKCLTPATWQKYQGQVAPISGFSLRDCINSGVVNQDSGTGVYAGDEECYTRFEDLFDPVIEAYHGFKKTDQHKTDMDASKLPEVPAADFEKYVISTRIRVGRNIAGYGLSPGIKREQRKECATLITTALNDMTGELKGKYYPLDGMTEADRQKLVDDHFLFKKGDRFLEAAGANREWPESRGIYHNDAKTFLVWVNEEDQMRIISMQNGGNVKEVFVRLAAGIDAVEKSMGARGKKFAHTPHHGYFHSCPTNLGTGMRASVMLKIPLVSELPDFEDICSELNLQPRGTAGEHSKSEGGVYDISNKYRLGYSEVELVTTMINGVKFLIDKEKALEGSGGTPAGVTPVAAPSGVVEPFPKLKSSNKSLMKESLNPEVWAKYQGVTTKAAKFTLKDCINSGVVNEDSGVGIYAGDEECYTTFKDVFDSVIQKYHNFSPTHMHKTDMDGEKLPDVGADFSKYVVSTRIRVGRSVAGYGLSPGLTKENRGKVRELVTSALAELTGELKGSYYPLEGMDEKTRQQLVDDHFLFKKGDRFLEAAGVNRDWPCDRGIFHNDTKTFLVWVNEEDQMRIISMEQGGDAKGIFKRLISGIKAIEESIKKRGDKFAHSEHHGYFHSCPSNLGTGMRASVMLKIPLLSETPEFEDICASLNLQARGVDGEHSKSKGGIYDISNKHRLGYSEVELVTTMIKGVGQLIKKEKNLEGGNSDGGFPNFAPENHSLMRAALTPEVWAKYEGVKSAQAGFTLKDCCNSGLENQDSGVGIYAGDEDCYTVFKDVFDHVIESYHKFSPTDTHKTDMDAEKLPNVPEEFSKYVISTRIRVGRSVAGYGLSPGISTENRTKVESLLKEALSDLTGELKGTYYPLDGMEEATRQQLVDDHFLFKKGDRFLEAGGANRDWPAGRGIFHNDAKTFLVWVNEEDQMRIISMEQGGDAKGIFKRLISGINAIEESIKKRGDKFAHSEHHGYFHSCPSNLGTGMRASVMLKIPLLSEHWRFETICAGLKLQPRGVDGEHSKSKGGVYDVSNKHRLGYSEVELVSTMISGVEKLISLEQSLERGEAITEGYPAFSETNTSLMRGALTEEIYQQLAGKKTSFANFTIEDCISSGVQNQDSSTGIYAGDEECYTLFAPVFDQIIEKYHNFSPTDMHKTDVDGEKLPDVGADFSKYVVSTRIRVGRSIAGYGISPGITKENRTKIRELVTDALSELTGELKGTYYPLEGMEEATRQQLVDDHFLFKKGDRFLEHAGANRDWPCDRGIFHNDAKTFLVWVNEEDQMRIISMEQGGDAKGIFKRLISGINAIEESIKKRGDKFAHSEHLGYIHSCPTNLGTGMRASVMLKVPLLSETPQFEEECAKLNLQPRGVDGEHSKSKGGVYDVSNKHRLGYSEVELVTTMIDGVGKLIEMEKALEK